MGHFSTISDEEYIQQAYNGLWLEVFFATWHRSDAYSLAMTEYLCMADPDEDGDETTLRLDFHTTALYEMAMDLWATAGGYDKVTRATNILFEIDLLNH